MWFCGCNELGDDLYKVNFGLDLEVIDAKLLHPTALTPSDTPRSSSKISFWQKVMTLAWPPEWHVLPNHRRVKWSYLLMP